MPDAQVCNCSIPGPAPFQILVSCPLQHKEEPAEQCLDPSRAPEVFQAASGGDTSGRPGSGLSADHPEPAQREAAMGCEEGLQRHR